MHVVHRHTGALAFKIATPADCEHVFSSAATADNGMAYFSCNSPTEQGSPSNQTGMLFAINPALHM